jgi:predicted nucleic acid-binding protein
VSAREAGTAGNVLAPTVVDASALSAVLFAEPEGDEVADRLAGGRLMAPTLLRYELANVCWKKLRAYPGQRAGLLAALGRISLLALDEIEVPAVEAATLAEATGLTAYDAAYLWLARRTGGTLVTLDRELAHAAG